MAAEYKGAALLKLRKIELLGFKSFCEKTTITFGGDGITCIVGPNGCGKSNIVDAISWVLGEQSHKMLRAERMADCIFNGTAKRPPLGMSEVLLTLVDPELVEAAKRVLEGAEQAELSAAAGAEAEKLNTEDTERSTEVTEKRAEDAERSTESTEQTEAPASAEEHSAEAAPETGTMPFKKKRVAKPAHQPKIGEVVVGRRLYRSGQSEYIINGRIARLRDIQELFMGTGLGPESYAIIEQGRIGLILSAKPADRRAILEEAAGVTKYKTKKRLAEARLEGAKTNLARVNDIFVEVEKQLASLKRQASKARRYAELREQIRSRQRLVLASKARELESEAERLEGLLRGVAAAEHEQALTLTALEAEQTTLAARSSALDDELRRVTNHRAECSLELDRAENRIAFGNERAREIAARQQQIAAEVAQAAAELAGADERREMNRRSLSALREERERLETALRGVADEASRAVDEQQAAETRIEELRHTAARLGEEQVLWRSEQAREDQALAQHSEAQARLEQQAQQLALEETQSQGRATAATNHADSCAEHAVSLGRQVQEVREQITRLRGEQEETTACADALREDLARARADHASLERVLDERSYTAEAVQKLFAVNGKGEERGFRAVGVLADYAEVAERYEGAIEQFLREELEYVVVETFDHARAGISLLRGEVGGRATFFVDSVRHLPRPEESDSLPFDAADGVVARLDALVDFRDPLGPAAKHFLPKLAAAYLVETAVSAERLSREHMQNYFVTPEGTCYHGRLVSGGRPGEAGPLQIKRELRTLVVKTAELERGTEQNRLHVEQLIADLRAAEQMLAAAQAEQIEAEKASVAATIEAQQAHLELTRVERQASDCRIAVQRLAEEAEASRIRATTARRMIEKALEGAAAAEAERAAAAERLAALRQLLAGQQEMFSARRAELAQMNERQAGAEAADARLTAESEQAGMRAAALAEQQQSLAREREDLAATAAELGSRLAGLTAEKTRLGERQAALETEFATSRARLTEIDDAERRRRQALNDLRDERGRHEIDRARNESDRNHLRETCVTELNAQPEEIIALEPELVSGEALAAAEAEQREMRAKIEAMGAVNMMALEEYQECEQRHTFLDRERQDLLASIADTQQAIRELDEVSRQKFEQAFEVINRNFAGTFQTLFGGGTGQMRLTEPDSSGEPGIEIVAQPPGKRLQNVMLLSGGEKAMTALALLIAIFRYQPSPFCILDEVDAPLDEANVGRFTRMLADMHAQTQFLVVTHNRKTMEMAEVLYGVTMQEPGVSKLVSVRWDEKPTAAAPPADKPVARAAGAAA
jgi:chromosome segregation protein